jgi:hypothetical protein
MFKKSLATICWLTIPNILAQESCPKAAPLFTAEIAHEVITSWAKGLSYSRAADLESTAMTFVAKHYTLDAILLPTLSKKIRRGQQEILDYFYHKKHGTPYGFLVNHPQESTNLPTYIASAYCGSGDFAGYYTFRLKKDAQAPEVVIKARFSMLIQYRPHPRSALFRIGNKTIIIPRSPGWYIGAQHSSLIPKRD